MDKLILIFLLLLQIVYVEAQTPEISKIKQQIENAPSKPDSVKYYMFRLLDHASQLHDTVIGKTYSHIGIQYNKLAILDSSEFYMKKALEYTENYPKVHGEMYLNLAINYRIGSRYNESLEASEKAIEMFKRANYQAGVGRAYGEMASNYNYMLNSEKALEYLKKSIAILSEEQNTRELHVVKQKLANLYYNKGDYAFARDIYEEVLPTFSQNKGTNYYSTLLTYADCLIQLEENYSDAEAALNEVVDGFKTLNNIEYMWLSLSNLAYVYEASGKIEKARQAFEKAHQGLYQLKSPRFMETSVRYLEFLNKQKQYNTALAVIKRVQATSKSKRLKMNADNEIAFLKQAIATYSQMGMVENSLQAFERIDFVKDSLHSAVNEAKALELQEKYQNELQRENNLVLASNNELLLEYNNKKDKILMLSVLSLALILVIGIVLFISSRNKLKMQQKLVATLENSKRVLEEKNTLQNQLRIEREKTLINKERELVEVSLEMSDLQNRILELLEHRENPESSQVLAEKLNELLSQNNYWKYFKGKFVEVHPAFAKQLSEMFPNLSDNEIAFCCMLKLQLSTKEIASLMGLSKEQVTSKKAALRRKMGLEDDILGFEKLIEHLE
ncbi:tetratricopeptide repeat protein [Aequorivita sp. F47161]|uniref:Tetratricopeptide repeat protein n=1 Tax=Aequorivita vitellina TaxID=2874475 RepID=A0A9X1UB55_9FLAO|nr:tetratricopeptide repeat protein [Aequorivita vitellina]MCG2420351.1 tetratricopeptide repeat protein [Aequorivita vitellina]